MKIYSWNVLCYNRQVDAVANHIEQLDFDVLCLQEVTPYLLERLKKMPFYMVQHVDVIRLSSRRREEPLYVVILSKQPSRNTGTLQFFDFPFPLHTRAFIAFMSFWKWSFVTERGAIYVDIPYGQTTLRIFSVHLTLWGPENRAKEFEAVIGHVEPGQPTVIGGDFNVIEYGPMKMLNWLLGAPLSHAMPWYPERDLFEERFKRAGLRNPLLGKVTHKFSKSQLDHILVSEDVAVTKAVVHPESHGSDHQPVSVIIQSR
jgi:endonuclease/exonuclease/phosphatase family metal-dependent hydrolase